MRRRIGLDGVGGVVLHHGAAIVCFLGALTLTGGASGATQVSLEVSSPSGEPGEEVAILFQGSSTVSLQILLANFNFPAQVGTFVRTSIEGTHSAHAMPRGIIYNPKFFSGGYMAGVRLDMQGQDSRIPAGDGLTFFKVMIRISPSALPGSHAFQVTAAEACSKDGGASFTPTLEFAKSGTITVNPPSGPRPVAELSCAQEDAATVLSWENVETYESLSVFRGGSLLASLPGASTSFRETPPLGPASYSVKAISGGKESLSASCGLLVQVPRPPAVAGLTCVSSGGIVTLDWTNPIAYEGLKLYRNGQVIAELDGAAENATDAWSSSLYTIYTLQGTVGGVDSIAANCALNVMSDVFVIWAEEVRAEPGDVSVPLRLYSTNPEPAQGIQFALRIDPAHVRIRELTLSGTACEAAEYDYFAYQLKYIPSLVEVGETAGAMQFDQVPPYGVLFPAGADQHILTVLVDVLPEAPSGAVVAIELGAFGQPKLNNVFDIHSQTQSTVTHDGKLLIGASPVPEVRNAQADRVSPPAGDRENAVGQGAAMDTLAIRWSNAASYNAIRVERDGDLISDLPGDSTQCTDSDPGPGIHRYAITAYQGARASFPTIVTTYPAGVPGTFLRGDANHDAFTNISDVVCILQYLFRSGPEPTCLDAADCDDNGTVNLTDPIALLLHLFRGGGSLPAPGGVTAWLDPSPDDLSCP